MHRAWRPGGKGAGSLDGHSTACSLEAWVAGSLDADGNDGEGGDEDAAETKTDRNSHTVELR